MRSNRFVCTRRCVWGNTMIYRLDRGTRIRRLAVKIRSVGCNNRKKAFEVHTSTKTLVFPFSSAELVPTAKDPVAALFVDREADREAFTYALQSGRTGTVHIEQVL